MASTAPLLAADPTSPLSSIPDHSSSPTKRRSLSLSPSLSSSGNSLSTNSSPPPIPRGPRTPSLSPSARRAAKRQRRRLSNYDKVLEVRATLRGVGWRVQDFLAALSRQRDRPRLRRLHRGYINFVYTQFPLEDDFADIIRADRELLATLFHKWGWTWMAATLRSELKALAGQQVFGHFDPPGEAGKPGILEYTKRAVPLIEELAPRWLGLLESTCQEVQQSGDKSFNVKRTVIIFGILCHMMRPNRSTTFQTIMGLYLYQGGARRRVLDTLCQLGFIMSYSTLQRRIEKLTEKAAREVQLVGQALSGVITYDNFDFAEGRRGERAGDQRVFRSITTCLAIEGRGFDHGRLEQHMWHPHTSLLSVERIAKHLRPSNEDWLIRRHHIESAIQALYPSRDGDIKFPWFTKMPEMKKLEPRKTKVYPMKPVMKDESTTSNNLQIIDDIYVKQIGIREDNPIYSEGLRLIYGDLKTWSRMRSAKELRHDVSEAPFDSLDWLLPGLGLWHLRLNMLQAIHRIHWGGPGPPDPSTLQYAADRWDRSRVVQPNDFQAIEDLIIHSYQARIAGIWLQSLRQQKMDPRNIRDTLPWLDAQSSTSWGRTLAAISSRIHHPPRTNEARAEPPARDQQFNNHQNFCAHVEVYLTLRYAIKHGDIGLLRHALRHVMVIFQAEAAEAPKYASALLYTIHLTDSPAATIRLQEAVLSNSLVNLQGAPGSNFELDRLLELLNNSLKVFQRERSYFSINSDQHLEHWALNMPFFQELKAAVEFCFGKPQSAKHTSKSAAEDIWSMALNMSLSSLRKMDNDRYSLHPTPNLYLAGLDRLSENVMKYNRQYTQDGTLDEEGCNDTEFPATSIDVADSVPASPTIPTELYQPIDHMFVE